MIQVLKSTRIHNKDLEPKKIANMKINTSHETTEAIDILRGVRQGCVIFPVIFNLYSVQILKEDLENIENELLVNGEYLNNKYFEECFNKTFHQVN